MKMPMFRTTILSLALLAAGALRAAGPEIVSLEERIALDPTGTATVAVTVKLAKAEAGTVQVPTRFKAAEGLKVEGLPGVAVALSDKGGVRAFALNLPAAPPDPAVVKIAFTVPGFYDWKKEKVADFGNRSLEYKFMNTLPGKVQAYALELMLPPGYLVNTVDDSTPKLTSKTPVPPYKILRVNGISGISIKHKDLGIGDTCSLKIRFKEDRKSIALLVGGLVLCGLYLVGYRDLVSHRPKA